MKEKTKDLPTRRENNEPRELIIGNFRASQDCNLQKRGMKAAKTLQSVLLDGGSHGPPPPRALQSPTPTTTTTTHATASASSHMNTDGEPTPVADPDQQTLAQTDRRIRRDLDLVLAGSVITKSYDGTSQYARSGISACGLASCNAVRITLQLERDGTTGVDLLRQMMTRQIVEDIIRICPHWKSPAHLEVDEIHKVPMFSHSLRLEGTEPETGKPDFASLTKLFRRLQTLATEHQQSVGAVLTKPPEIFALFAILTRLPPPGPPTVLVIFDSHPRPQRNLNGTSFSFFINPTAAAGYLSRLLSVDPSLAKEMGEDWQLQLLLQYSVHLFFATEPSSQADLETEIDDASTTILDMKSDLVELRSKSNELKLKDAVAESRITQLEQELQALREELKKTKKSAKKVEKERDKYIADLEEERYRAKRRARSLSNARREREREQEAGLFGFVTNLFGGPSPSSSRYVESRGTSYRRNEDPSYRRGEDTSHRRGEDITYRRSEDTHRRGEDRNRRSEDTRGSRRHTDRDETPRSSRRQNTTTTSSSRRDHRERDRDTTPRPPSPKARGSSSQREAGPSTVPSSTVVPTSTAPSAITVTPTPEKRPRRSSHRQSDLSTAQSPTMVQESVARGRSRVRDHKQLPPLIIPEPTASSSKRKGRRDSHSTKPMPLPKTIPTPPPGFFPDEKEFFGDPVPPKPLTFECNICFQTNREEDLALFDGCDHLFCRDCMKEYIETTVKDLKRYPILCPVCRVKAGPEEGVVTRDVIEIAGLSEELIEQWVELQLAKHAVNVDCKNCGVQVRIDREDFMTAPLVACPRPNCDYIWCKACLQPVETKRPEDHSCDGMVELAKLMQSQRWRRCPGCQTPIERFEGCNHMTCTVPNCNTHFCYVDGDMIIQSQRKPEIDVAIQNHYGRADHGLFDIPPDV
ncbi:hypothetical protein M407DRAFT_17584 [Tulasnella calospora MUT 4182]|uniref:RBR-type E3 ubiquitin transferase n=1 Tax=Tulasnella calospora MUT 4182 TaxID=1051891 RepID=A0A0C3LI05_9AGAM|nr:hypothetical protein M407DRAFT_17584 [Tulasnella calospora MUT 4182]